MNAGLDTGDIITQERTLIHPTDNGQTLHDRLALIFVEFGQHQKFGEGEIHLAIGGSDDRRRVFLADAWPGADAIKMQFVARPEFSE